MVQLTKTGFLIQKKEGVKFSPSEENNKFPAEIFNVKEVKDLGRFLDIVEKQK